MLGPQASAAESGALECRAFVCLVIPAIILKKCSVGEYFDIKK